MNTAGSNTAVNLYTHVFVPDSRAFVALMAGPFCLQLTALEALAIAAMLRLAASDARNGRGSQRLTTIRMENWSVLSVDGGGAVAMGRKAVVVRFTEAEADRCADLLDDAGDAMNAERFGAVRHA
jgi:hypothetical protein